MAAHVINKLRPVRDTRSDPREKLYSGNRARLKTSISTRKAVPVILAVLSILLTLGAFELVLWMIGYWPALHSGWLLQYPSLRVPDRSVILVPPWLLCGDHYATDPDQRVVLGIGDSFTEGVPVEPQYQYLTLLEEYLTDADGTQARVINAGIGDSGPDQQLRLLTDHILPNVRPAIVIWELYANDLQDNYVMPTYEIDGGRLSPLDGAWNWLYLRHGLYLRAPLPAWIKERSHVFRLLLKATEAVGEWAIPSEYTNDPSAWSLKKLRLELLEFNTLASEYGFRPYVMLIAPEAVYLARKDPNWANDWKVRDYHRIGEVLDNQPSVVHAWFPKADPKEIFTDSSRDTGGRGNHHFSEAGYALVAETLAARILGDERRNSAR